MVPGLRAVIKAGPALGIQARELSPVYRTLLLVGSNQSTAIEADANGDFFRSRSPFSVSWGRLLNGLREALIFNDGVCKSLGSEDYCRGLI